MGIRLALVAMVALCGAAATPADTLRFKYAAGDKYKISGTVEEEVYVNGRLDHRAQILNKIAAEVTQVREDSGLLRATFQTSERRTDSVPFGLDQDYESEFWRDGRGVYDIDPRLFMPVVRDVPLFPPGEIKPGDSWVGAGSEAHDFRQNGIPEPLAFPITVAYRYVRDELTDGRRIAVIGMDYTVFQRMQLRRVLAEFDPVLITGFSSQLLRFDIELGQPVSYEERFDFIFTLSSGDTVEYRGSAVSELTETPALDRQKLADEIRKALDKERVQNVTVGVGEQGVTITLENVQFGPDSAVLLPAEKQKLQKIADIIRPIDRDVLVVGHTARVGSEETSQTLSEARARSVVSYLLSLGAKKQAQIVYRGMGSQEPIADNSTEAGRSRNRRVEITILEN